MADLEEATDLVTNGLSQEEEELLDSLSPDEDTPSSLPGDTLGMTEDPTEDGQTTDKALEQVEEQTAQQTDEATTESSEQQIEPTESESSEENHEKQVNGVQSSPQKVTVAGTGLTGGILGKELNFDIDTRKGGPGELTAYCAGPKGVAYCELVDRGNGTFHLKVKPDQVGEHVLQVHYEGQAVAGSPFKLLVSANTDPDPNKVRVTGPGVEHGVLRQFQSHFTVDTRGAGAGNLTVRMRGPKGAFRMEMRRASQGDRRVLCDYNPLVSGFYVIFVRWSGMDVPGSPFQVRIYDHEFDMERSIGRRI